MCGIVGLVAQTTVNQRLYDALTVLQHRGQDAAGIATDDGGYLRLRKDNGLVRDVFRTKHMRKLMGTMGIGHCRYPTAGCASSAEAQPFYVNAPYGITLAHNGNLTNSDQLTKEVYQTDLRHVNTTSDSEVLLNVFAHELHVTADPEPTPEGVFRAVSEVHRRCRGAYAAVAMINGHGIVAFRDPKGIRPLIYGQRHTLQGVETMFASESVALDSLGYEVVRDVAPGEAIYVDRNGNVHEQQCAEAPTLSPCIFEHVYLARPDSFVDGISVYKARLRMGEKLAEKVMRLQPDHDIDVVMPIPDSGRTSALSMAVELGVKYREGFIKNRYIGRTFIMPGQTERRKSVRKKLNPIDLEFRGKVVCLVDDSIVRGTTCSQIIEMARQCGAKKVYYCSAAPPVRHPNVYGIDMPAAQELIAHDRSVDEVAAEIGADWLIYQDLDDLIECAQEGNPQIEEFECSVFDGRYITGDIDAGYLSDLEQARNDLAKAERESKKAAEAEV
ncbi:amidophosphoribosyltransferase [Algisphaera agarilytica]|uniref:Amidophosphoribosyltransferase n=1 Tax=Algisphaera agarilytica TaxID=1385975 RepID=A0A7X0H7T9_9BACT|nr:amidophosphoribosyltransferase [Algisphaera agarilytica]MBB6430880.1 amidophosphoribosyltransferase [Algisphaera agarilytica]